MPETYKPVDIKTYRPKNKEDVIPIDTTQYNLPYEILPFYNWGEAVAYLYLTPSGLLIVNIIKFPGPINLQMQITIDPFQEKSHIYHIDLSIKVELDDDEFRALANRLYKEYVFPYLINSILAMKTKFASEVYILSRN